MATNISVPTAALREYTKTAPCPYTETQLKQAGRRAEVEDKTTTADEDKEILHNDADDEKIPPTAWLVLAFLAYLIYLATL